jgi:chromosome segregation ATPase
MSEVNEVKKQEVDIVSSILSALNSKDNKVLEEIKKLRDELKDRDEALRKTITKLEKTLTDCNPSSIIEIIKRIQAEVETKDDLLQIFKEDLEETLDKYYELYKKLKDVKYDMEDMVYGKDKK